MLSAAQETGAVLSDKAAGLGIFVQLFPEVVKEVSLALMPLVVMFVAFQIFLCIMVFGENWNKFIHGGKR